jgi:pimeloyl-ACP methyl ester carboxylesterase
MTPLEAALIAESVYSAPPVIGHPNAAARAVVFPGAIAFPGTDNIACWLADLDVVAVNVPGFGRLHAGFWQAWNEIRDQVLALDGIDVCIGHSEGAALALLCAAHLCLIGKAPSQVFAFEPPRISADGTLKAVLDAVELNLYRNGNDVVPIVPRLLETWQHPSPLISIGVASAPFPNVEDHLIANVVASIRKVDPTYGNPAATPAGS